MSKTEKNKTEKAKSKAEEKPTEAPKILDYLAGKQTGVTDRKCSRVATLIDAGTAFKGDLASTVGTQLPPSVHRAIDEIVDACARTIMG
jgi:hypothetical protein